jgi:hypothetical protein
MGTKKTIIHKSPHPPFLKGKIPLGYLSPSHPGRGIMFYTNFFHSFGDEGGFNGRAVNES